MKSEEILQQFIKFEAVAYRLPDVRKTNKVNFQVGHENNTIFLMSGRWFQLALVLKCIIKRPLN